MSASYVHSLLSCQPSTIRVGGSQTTTLPQSHSLPSTQRSYQRPPSRGSIIASTNSACPMWCEGGHQPSKPAVNVENALSGETATVIA